MDDLWRAEVFPLLAELRDTLEVLDLEPETGPEDLSQLALLLGAALMAVCEYHGGRHALRTSPVANHKGMVTPRSLRVLPGGRETRVGRPRGVPVSKIKKPVEK
ncbi:hypothetical protein G3N55_00195 [Dissulfurirhabdus thermomarina]|uniref:Uncharacterized protein n=1 Tax=Dissulfurirhabdus thermomarina TaxID=1765737 RepID=A0A6N9TLG6_DISTH|nr:hypothetical protein [Dissulfurirhabdus thermomarina]NDY41270.1 hypothetical protein [Dissulfurirhabdus thermomarina]